MQLRYEKVIDDNAGTEDNTINTFVYYHDEGKVFRNKKTNEIINGKLYFLTLEDGSIDDWKEVEQGELKNH